MFAFRKKSDGDLMKSVVSFYNNINPVYRHSFWIIFLITNIVFGFYTINFFWGNHDWDYMIKGMSIKHSFFEGRYGAFIVSKILTGGLYLPIISALWAFAALSLSSVLLAIYWKIPQKVSCFIIFGLAFSIIPYTCVWLFFGHWIVDIYFARLFIFIAFILAAKYAMDGTKIQKIWVNIAAILLLNFGISVYQALIGTVVMVFAGRILIEMLDWQSFKTGIKNTFHQNKWIFLDIICATILYKIILQFMKHNNQVKEDFYNLQTISIHNIPSKIVECIKTAWAQFTDFSTVFYPDILTKLFLVLALIFWAQILFNKQRSPVLKIFIILAFFITLCLTKLVACIATVNVTYATRIDFCGYALFNILIVCLCLKGDDFLRDIKFILMGIIIYIFAINCFHYQRTYQLGFEAEKMLWNRMLGRLESQPGFNPAKKYTVIYLGKHASMRKNYYPKNNKTIMDREMITFSFDCPWKSLAAMNFYNLEFIKKTFGPDRFSNPEFMKVLKRLSDGSVLEKAKAWPSQNSIIVYKDIILVTMEDKSLKKAKNMFNKEQTKEK